MSSRRLHENAARGHAARVSTGPRLTDLRDLAGLRCRPVSLPLAAAADPDRALRRMAGEPGLVCLRGCWAGGTAILASDPLLVLPDGADPGAALGVQPSLTASGADLVGGGWFGWIAFDGPSRVAFYDHLIRYVDGAWFFEALWTPSRAEHLQRRQAHLAGLLRGPDRAVPWAVGTFAGASMAAHLRAVERTVEAIRAGEIYQANVCTRLRASFSGSAAGLFADAVAELAPAFGAFLDAGDRAVVSLSPELFLRRRGRAVRTEPIKGTWPGTGAAGAEALRRSAKDTAENVMIVDLLRNDLGRVCVIGSVRVPDLLRVRPHPGLWHLVSAVAGTLREEVGDGDLLAAAFPPGSVTGAPKLRALEVIAEVESGPRRAYTGALGFASPCWGTELNVAIRTFETRGAGIELGVGGGVTADSVPMLEWRECLHKAAPLLGALGADLAAEVATPLIEPTPRQLAGGLLETLLARDGVVLRLGDHLARLDRSCRELYGAGVPGSLASRLRGLAGDCGAGRWVLRVTVSPQLRCRLVAAPAPPARAPGAARVVTGRTGLWRHKWADRAELEAAETPGTVPIFVAGDGAVLETSRGNLFLLRPDGTLVTAPLRDDLLPGVTRRALLDAARDAGRRTELRAFGVEDLVRHAALWTSSISGAVAITSVDGRPLPRRDAEVAALARMLGGGPTVR